MAQSNPDGLSQFNSKVQNIHQIYQIYTKQLKNMIASAFNYLMPSSQFENFRLIFFIIENLKIVIDYNNNN